MMRRIACVAVGALLLAGNVRAQATTAHPTSPSVRGAWYGTSICTAAGKPACHDETVVYHFTIERTDSTHEQVSLQASKIVNGVEDDMGTLACEHDARAPRVVPHARELALVVRRARGYAGRHAALAGAGGVAQRARGAPRPLKTRPGADLQQDSGVRFLPSLY